jgi:DNA polymerase elongation subunit (family B)
MSRDKQIEEMARDINIADHEYCNGKCVGCEHKPMRIENCACVDIAIAKGLVNAGYRKASDVAREIFEEIEHKLPIRIVIEGELVYNANIVLEELKKKYLGEDINAPTKESEGEG